MEINRRAWTTTNRIRRTGTILAILAVLTVSAARSYEERIAPSEQTDPFAVLRPLVGWWEGSVEGRLGTGKAVRRYEFIVGGKYLMSRHSSVRLPQEKTPEGDQHEEIDGAQGIVHRGRGQYPAGSAPRASTLCQI